MSQRDGAAEYIASCKQRNVDPALELVLVLRGEGPVHCTLAHRQHPLGDDHAEAVADGLSGVPVVGVSVEGNNLTARGAAALAKVIAESATLESFKIGENDIGDVGAAKIAEAVKMSSSIRRLDMRSNNIGCDGISALAAALRKTPSLSELSLQKNAIGDDGCRSLAYGLRKNTSIHHLSLRFNDIGDPGVIAFAETLRECHITSLDLGGNRIGAAGSKALAEALGGPHRVCKLNLRSNSVGSIGASAFATALMGSCGLTELFLGFNCIPESGAIEIFQALESNTELRKLDLQGVLLGAQGEAAVAAMLSCNTTLNQIVLELDTTRAECGRELASSILQNTTLEEASLGDDSTIDTTVSKIIADATRCNRLLRQVAIECCGEAVSSTVAEQALRVAQKAKRERGEMSLLPAWRVQAPLVINKLQQHKLELGNTKEMLVRQSQGQDGGEPGYHATTPTRNLRVQFDAPSTRSVAKDSSFVALHAPSSPEGNTSPGSLTPAVTQQQRVFAISEALTTPLPAPADPAKPPPSKPKTASAPVAPPPQNPVLNDSEAWLGMNFTSLMRKPTTPIRESCPGTTTGSCSPPGKRPTCTPPPPSERAASPHRDASLWREISDVKFGLQRLESSLQPQLADLADTLENLQKHQQILDDEQKAGARRFNQLTTAVEAIQRQLERSLHSSDQQKVPPEVDHRLDTLEITLQELSEKSVDMKLKQEASINDLETAVNEASSAIVEATTTYRSTRQEVADSLQAMSSQFTRRIEQLLEATEERTNTLKRSVEDVQELAVKVEAKVSRIEVAHEDEMSAIQRQCTENVRALHRQEQAVSGLGAQLSALQMQEKPPPVSTDALQAIHKRVDDLLTRVINNEEMIIDSRKAIVGIQDEVADKHSQSALQDDIAGRLAALEAEFQGASGLRAQLHELPAQLMDEVTSKVQNYLRQLEEDGTVKKFSTIFHRLNTFSNQLNDFKEDNASSHKKTLKRIEGVERQVKATETKTTSLTQKLASVAQEYTDALSTLPPKMDDLRRAATEKTQDAERRMDTIDAKINSLSSELRTCLRDKERTPPPTGTDKHTSEFLQRQIDSLQAAVSSAAATHHDSKTSLTAALEALQAQVLSVAEETKRLQSLVTPRAQTPPPSSSWRGATTPHDPATVAQLQNTVVSLSDTVLAMKREQEEHETQRSRLAEELALLRKEAQEAHELTNKLKRKLWERSTSPVRGAEGFDSRVAQQLNSRLDMLEEMLKKDQQASLKALEAILAERDIGEGHRVASMSSSPAMPHVFRFPPVSHAQPHHQPDQNTSNVSGNDSELMESAVNRGRGRTSPSSTNTPPTSRWGFRSYSESVVTPPYHRSRQGGGLGPLG